jgi:hypothetical protein
MDSKKSSLPQYKIDLIFLKFWIFTNFNTVSPFLVLVFDFDEFVVCVKVCVLYRHSNVIFISTATLRTHKKVITMLIIVIVIFAVCWIPYHVLFLYLDESGFTTTEEQTILVFFFQWLMYGNSACNPIVYAVCNLNYRREFLEMIKCNTS